MVVAPRRIVPREALLSQAGICLGLLGDHIAKQTASRREGRGVVVDQHLVQATPPVRHQICETDSNPAWQKEAKSVTG